ncbi:MAG: hypothetical protein HPZ81_05850 [Oscillospiraceae bacterium]|nr:hypothetical protein [Oscillospiraceae bacterium]
MGQAFITVFPQTVFFGGGKSGAIVAHPGDECNASRRLLKKENFLQKIVDFPQDRDYNFSENVDFPGLPPKGRRVFRDILKQGAKGNEKIRRCTAARYQLAVQIRHRLF